MNIAILKSPGIPANYSGAEKKVINFLGIKVSVLTTNELVERILEFALFGKRKMITYLNAYCVNVSFDEPEYKKILNATDIVYADGISIVWGSRLLGKPPPERVTDLDFFDRLVEDAVRKNISFYFLGGRPSIAQMVADRLRRRLPGLKILGTHHGYFDKIQEVALIKEINILKPNILIIGMGVPKQEKWIYRHLNQLEVNLCWAIGTFDNLTGLLKRAPSWMINAGLEWLYRLYKEPRRLWRRYLIGNFIFVYRVLRWRLQSLFF